MLDHVKAIRMGGYSIDMTIKPKMSDDEDRHVSSMHELAYA
jgi:hypothetical protein